MYLPKVQFGSIRPILVVITKESNGDFSFDGRQNLYPELNTRQDKNDVFRHFQDPDFQKIPLAHLDTFRDRASNKEVPFLAIGEDAIPYVLRKLQEEFLATQLQSLGERKYDIKFFFKLRDKFLGQPPEKPTQTEGEPVTVKMERVRNPHNGTSMMQVKEIIG
jgi:hypothetical protein